MRALRFVLRLFAAVFAVAALLLAFVYALLRSGLIDDRVDEIVTLLARKKGVFFVRAEDISGDLPFHLKAKKVEVGDGSSVYLTIEDAEATWHPFDLFHPFDHVKWRIHVDDIRARRVAWTHLPHDIVPDDEPFHWDRFVRIVVGHLRVEDFELSGTLLDGAVARVSAEGSGVLGEWDHGFVKLALEHVDGRRGKAAIDLATHGSPLELSGRITADEGPGGALAALARLPDAGAVTLDVRAAGPMRDWRAEADVTAERIGTLHAKAGLAFNADGPFDASATFDPVPAQRERYLVGAGEPIAVTARGAWAPDVELRLDRVALVADGRELTATGRLNLATREFRLDAGLASLRDNEAVHLTLLDAAAARLHADGVLGDAGHLDATLDVDAPRRAAVASSTLHASLKARDAKGDSVPTFDLAADATGVTVGGETAPLFGDRVRLAAAGRIDLPRGTIKAEGVHVEGGDLRVQGPLEFTPDWSGLVATLRAEATSLQSLAPLGGFEVAGRASATLELTAKSQWQELDAVFRLTAADVALGEAGWNALLGGTTGVDAEYRGAPRGAATARATLKTAGVEASLTGQSNDGGQGLVADARIVVDNLARLADPSRAAIAGRFEASARMRGDLERLEATAEAHGSRLALNGFRADSLEATLDAKGGAHAWTAGLRGETRLGNQKATMVAEIAQPSAGRLTLGRVLVDGPRSRAEASLDLDLERGLASGTLKARSEDLKAWGPMTGIDAGGSFDVDATLAAAGGAQQASGRVGGRGLSLAVGGAGLFVRQFDATADGVQLGSRPRGHATVQIAQARYGATTLVDGRVDANGDGAGWAFDSSVDVHDLASVRVAVAGVLTPGPPLALALSRASGTVAEIPVALTGPATLRMETDAWSLSGLALAVGNDGRVTADVARTAGRTRVAANAKALPLALVSAFAPSLDLSGTIDATARAEGADLASSTGEISVRGQGVGSTGLEHQGVAPVNVQADARLGGRRLRASASVAGLTDSRVELAVDAPLVAASTADPVVVDVLWKGSIAEVAALLPFGEDAVGGRIDANLRLSGTVASPRVTGRATVADGFWENAASGLVLRSLNAELQGNGGELRLARLDATDGEDGAIGASGRVLFGRFPAFDADFSLQAKGARVARLDLVTARADANVTLNASRGGETGAPVTGSVHGSVRIDEARIAIPQRFVSDLPEIDVVEGGDDAGVVKAGGPAPARSALGLDVAVVADNRIFVTGRGLESEWASDVHVRGDTADPRIEGTVRSVHGQLSLLGKRFDVESGTVRFDGAAGNVPYLAMTARADANDITAIASVTGPALSPAVELRSEPPLPRDEVLSRVLFGRSAANLTALQSVQLARSLAELTGSPLGGGSGLLTGIGRTLGFDRLAIESDDADGGAALTASRYLTDNVYLRVQQGLTPEASKLSIEWKVMKHVTIESDVSQDAQGEVGATWRWDY